MGDLYQSAIGQAVDGEDDQEYPQQQYTEEPHHSSNTEHQHSREVSHLEEKLVAKEYSSQVFEQAIVQNVVEPEDERTRKQRELEAAGLEGEVEDFEKAALKIQTSFKKKKQNVNK